jgi:hypothetical protein
MKLCYRGVNYNREPLSLEVSESEIMGKYRGQEYHRCYPRHVPQLNPKPRLQYRGLAYQTCPLIQTEASLNAQLAAIARACGQIPPLEDEKTEKAADIHRENLRHNLDRRLEIARAKGDRDLVRLLEKECKQLAI